MNRPVLEARYLRLCSAPSDINEHLPTLRLLASECDTVSELGTYQGASTTALVLGAKELVTSCDHAIWGDVASILREAEWLTQAAGGRFFFIRGDTRSDVAVPGPCDMLFIDTYHNAGQLTAELAAHGAKPLKIIALHDTVSFGERGDDGGPGLMAAVRDFLSSNPKWRIDRHYENNNGLLVLRAGRMPTLPAPIRLAIPSYPRRTVSFGSLGSKADRPFTAVRHPRHR